MIVYKTHENYIDTPEERKAIWLCEHAIRNGECWDCHLEPNQKGYSNVTIGGREGEKWRAHRLVYTVIHGDIPRFGVIRHTCDNRRCIRPKHLLLGTDADNTADMMARGRHKFILPDNRKLTEADITNIMALRNLGYTYKEIADCFNVCTSTIMNNIRKNADVNSRN